MLPQLFGKQTCNRNSRPKAHVGPQQRRRTNAFANKRSNQMKTLLFLVRMAMAREIERGPLHRNQTSPAGVCVCALAS